MALIAWDGFDHYNSIVDMAQRFGTLQYFSLADVLIVAEGRAGYGKCLELGGTFNAFNLGLSAAVQKVTFGFAINFQGVGTAVNFNILDQIDAGATQCSWNINPGTGTISFTDATGTVVGTGLNAIGANGWYFVELQTTISAGAGTAALRVNGQALPSFPDLTGLHTQATANASMSGMNIKGVTGNQFYFDDMYIADGTTGPGSYPANSFLGDVRCATLFPIGNNSVTWTPLANTNWQEVSEVAMDSDTSYNVTATAGAQDSFNFSSLDSDINQVIGIQVTVAVRKEDAGSRTVAPVLVIGGTTYVGTAVSVDVSYLYITSKWPVNPATSASWTPADIASLKAGYLVVT